MSTLDDFLRHPVETLERALHIRKQIDQLNQALKELFGPSPVSLAGLQASVPRKRGRPRKVIPLAATGSEGRNDPAAAGPRKRRKMSAAAKAKIAAAQRARWAKAKSSHGPLTAVAIPEARPTTGKPARQKRKMSPEAREHIAAAQRARWTRQKGTAGPATAVAMQGAAKRVKK